MSAALNRLLDLSWTGASDVAQHQPQGASERRVGSIALSERIQAPVHADLFADRTVDDHHRRQTGGRGDRAVQGKATARGSLD